MDALFVLAVVITTSILSAKFKDDIKEDFEHGHYFTAILSIILILTPGLNILFLAVFGLFATIHLIV